MKAVVLCSGLAKRMGGVVKPLLKIAGREIIYRSMKFLENRGIDEFIVVVNRINREKIEDFLKRNDFRYRIVVNDHPERGNGYSFYLAREYIDSDFVLIMGDHVYEERFIDEALKLRGLICDRKPRFIDVSEATKVLVKDGRVEKIGKKLKDFTCVDTGFFVLSPDIFDVAEDIVREKDVIELSEIMERAGVEVSCLDGYFWMDIDTVEEAKQAKKIIVSMAVKGREDGFISRHLNRKVSTRISSFLVDKIEPIHATWLSFFAGIISSFTIFFSIPLAGVLYQFSSIFDGVDGEIARAAMKTSKHGGWLDSILDRYVDSIFLLLLAFATLRGNYEWLIAVLAIFGSFMISYTTERYKAEFGESFYKKYKPIIFGKRDERIFIVMLFCLLSFCIKAIYLFAFLAIITNLRVVESVLRALS